MGLYQLAGKRVFVAGHRGMVGAAIVRRLAAEDCEILSVPHSELDLRDGRAVRDWFETMQPQAVFLAAAKVGGIAANDAAPADFLIENLEIATSVIRAAYESGAEKLLFLGSSCIYPKYAPQPLVESALLTGALEPTNEAYAIAKIAGLKLCQAYRRQYGCDFISAMPTNLYGPGDNYDLETSHVLPALLAKAEAARRKKAGSLTIWGSGLARREFLHADDCADALVFIMKTWSAMEPVNVGMGSDISILELAQLISEVVGFRGEILKDVSRPDGTPQKLLDVTRLFDLGWRPSISLRNGIASALEDYRSSQLMLSAARRRQ